MCHMRTYSTAMTNLCSASFKVGAKIDIMVDTHAQTHKHTDILDVFSAMRLSPNSLLC